jgi:hypothetical protein
MRIFSLFSKKKLNNNDLDDNIIKKINKKYLSIPYHKNNINDVKITRHIVDVKFLKYITKWVLNRDLDENHWKNIYNSLKENFVLLQPLSICIYNNNYMAIDGQHRIKAIITLLEEKINIKNKIRIDMYYPNNINDMINIISLINNVKPIEIKQLMESNVSKIIQFIHKTYINKNKCIIKQSDKCYRPYINELRLKNKLNGCKNISISNNIKYILDEIKNINNKYKEMKINELKFNNKDISDKTYKIAKNFNCFLGLDNIFLWVDHIEQQLINSTETNNIQL